LAWNLDGRYKGLKVIQSGISDGTTGVRKYDVVFSGGYCELKFGGNRVQVHQVREDKLIIQQGTNVRYDFVSHPKTGRATPEIDFLLLRKYNIPYKVWGKDFWTLGRGGGLGRRMTWKPSR
jgi:hypothetical protein